MALIKLPVLRYFCRKWVIIAGAIIEHQSYALLLGSVELGVCFYAGHQTSCPQFMV